MENLNNLEIEVTDAEGTRSYTFGEYRSMCLAGLVASVVKGKRTPEEARELFDKWFPVDSEPLDD